MAALYFLPAVSFYHLLLNENYARLEPIDEFWDLKKMPITGMRDLNGMDDKKVIDLDAQRRKKKIISKIEEIPPLPAAANEVLTIVAENPKDIRRLEQVIVHDPSLSLQVLKVANCAAYYPVTRITTVKRAIVFLGFSEVRSIALSLSVSSLFKGKRSKTGFDRQSFWEHSIGVAMISRVIAGELELKEIDMYFTCGLLHDIGRMVMDTCFQKEWKQILKLAVESEMPLIKAERKYGYPHNVIGAWLLKNWGLPKVYQRVVATHHLSPKNPHFSLEGGIIGLADKLCHDIGMGLYKSRAVDVSSIAKAIGLGKERLELLEDHIQKISEIAEAITQTWL